MIPFHIEFYGHPVDNFRYIIDTALNESIVYRDLFNYTLTTARWANYKYILDGLTNRTPQGSFEYQFSATATCARLYDFLNSTDAHGIVILESILPPRPYVYTSNDKAWIAGSVIVGLFVLACIVCIIRLPHNKPLKRTARRGDADSIVSYV
jgi:hypothetical protein